MLVLLLLLSGLESPSSAPSEAAKKKILTVPTLQHDSALRDYKQNSTRNYGRLNRLRLATARR